MIQKKRELVLDAIIKNAGVSAVEIAKILSIPQRTVSTYLTALVRQGEIVRDRARYWHREQFKDAPKKAFKQYRVHKTSPNRTADARVTLRQEVVDIVCAHGPVSSHDIMKRLVHNHPSKGSLHATLAFLNCANTIKRVDGLWDTASLFSANAAQQMSDDAPTIHRVEDNKPVVEDAISDEHSVRTVMGLKGDIDWLFDVYIPKLLQENKDLWRHFARFGEKARQARVLYETRRVE